MGDSHTLRSLRWLAVSAPALVLTLACSDEEHPPISTPCLTCNNPVEAGVLDAYQPPFGDADLYKGARGKITGTLAFSAPPSFPVFPTEPILTAPAHVHFPYAHYDYTTVSDSTGAFTLANVPLGASVVLIEDIDGKNGILPTMQEATTKDGDKWSVPAIRRVDLEGIYLQNGLTMRADRAQVVFTLYAPGPGLSPAQGVTISLGDLWDGVLVDTAEGTFTKGMTTGPAGTIIFANVKAADYPGERVSFSYRYAGESGDYKREFSIASGIVTRAAAIHQLNAN